jgi:hypothetical protein
VADCAAGGAVAVGAAGIGAAVGGAENQGKGWRYLASLCRTVLHYASHPLTVPLTTFSLCVSLFHCASHCLPMSLIRLWRVPLRVCAR